MKTLSARLLLVVVCCILGSGIHAMPVPSQLLKTETHRRAVHSGGISELERHDRINTATWIVVVTGFVFIALLPRPESREEMTGTDWAVLAADIGLWAFTWNKTIKWARAEDVENSNNTSVKNDG